MRQFHARIELDTRDAAVAVELMSQLTDYDPVVGTSVRGWIEVDFRLPAAGLRQAASSALAVVESAAGLPALSVEILPTEEHLARLGHTRHSLPELVGTAEAAEMLGLTRARVNQLIEEKRLPAARAGKAYVMVRSTVEQFAAR